MPQYTVGTIWIALRNRWYETGQTCWPNMCAKQQETLCRHVTERILAVPVSVSNMAWPALWIQYTRQLWLNHVVCDVRVIMHQPRNIRSYIIQFGIDVDYFEKRKTDYQLPRKLTNQQHYVIFSGSDFVRILRITAYIFFSINLSRNDVIKTTIHTNHIASEVLRIYLLMKEGEYIIYDCFLICTLNWSKTQISWVWECCSAFIGGFETLTTLLRLKIYRNNWCSIQQHRPHKPSYTTNTEPDFNSVSIFYWLDKPFFIRK